MVCACVSILAYSPCVFSAVLVLCVVTCLLSFSLQPCSLIRDPVVRSTTVRQRSMCLTDLSLVRAHSYRGKR